MRFLRRASTSNGKSSFALSLDPETARSMHDEELPDEAFKGRQVLLDVRPQVLLDAHHANHARVLGWHAPARFLQAYNGDWQDSTRPGTALPVIAG
jgi:hypothetical protein